MMKVFQGEDYLCEYRPRVDNDYSTNTQTFLFRAQVITNTQKMAVQPIQGLLTDNVRLTLYSSNFEYDAKRGDAVIINGEKYAIDFFGKVENSTPYTLGASRFATKHLNKGLAKIIGLV